MNHEKNHLCPPYLAKTVQWITEHAHMMQNWEQGVFRSLGYDWRRIERHFASIVLNAVDKDLLTALYLISKGFNNKVPARHMDQAFATGLVSPELKIMYAFAQQIFQIHADVWIDENGNNSDFNGNLEE